MPVLAAPAPSGPRTRLLGALRAAPGRPRPPDAVAEVAALLDEQGYAAEPAAEGIALRRCPLHGLAHPGVGLVCAVHEGLVAAALDELDPTLAVDGIDVGADGAACIVRVSRRTGSGRRSARRTASPHSGADQAP